jgi:hypothetical protein
LFIAAAETHISEAQGVRVIVETAPFKKDKHKLSFHRFEGTDQDVLLKIDDRDYSGCDGCVPRTEIISVAFEISGSRYTLPRSSYCSLFNPHLGLESINPNPQISVSSRTVTVYFSGGDGAGSYNVQWKFNIDTLTGIRYLREHPSPEKAKVQKFKLTKPTNKLQPTP